MQQIQVQTVIADKASYQRNAQKIIDQVKANDMEMIESILEYALQIFNSDDVPLKKFLILRLIKDMIVIKCGKFINKYVQNRPLLNFIGNICTHKLGDDSVNRGSDLFNGQDPQSSAEFQRLALELVEHLAVTFPKDSKGAPTKFKIQYDELKQMGVKFLPKSELMNPFDPNLELPQKSAINNVNKDRDETMLELNNLKQSTYADIEMIADTFQNDQELQFINDVMETYSESMEMIENSLKKQIAKALKYEGVLNEDEQAELLTLSDFAKQFQQYYKGYLQELCTPKALKIFKDKTLKYINKINNKDFDYDLINKQQKQKKQKSQIELENEQLEKIKQQSKIEYEQQLQKSIIQQQEQQKREYELKKKEAEEARIREELFLQEQQKQLKIKEEQERKENERKLEQQKQEQIRQEQIRQEQIRQEQIRQEQIRQEQIKKQKQEEEAKQAQFKLIQETQYSNQFQFQNNQFQEQFQNNYVTPTKIDNSIFNSQQYQQKQSKYSQQPQLYQYPSQYVDQDVNQLQNFITPQQDNQFEKSNFGQQKQLSNIQQQGKIEFDENFDGLSQSTITQQFFPLKMLDQRIIIKQHTGQLIYYNDSQFQVLQKNGLSDQQIKRFKIATLKGKAALVNSPQFQIGVKQSLQYVPLKEKNYLKLIIYIGNKTQSPFLNTKIIYGGDNKQFQIWLKPEKIKDRIEPGEQIQQEIIGTYKQYENYKLINVIFQSEWANKSIQSNYYIPITLVSFLDFQEINLQIFRTKWRGKKQQIQKSQTFILNPKIVKTAYHIKKLFPKLCEFNSYQQFQDQQFDYFTDRQQHYISYKLGGIFEITHLNRHYMIKFIVLPNMQCTIQIIGQNDQLCRQIINTLNWLLGLEQ